MKPTINSNISIIGVASDLGAGTSGTSLGPAAIRFAGIVESLQKLGYEVKDEGDILANRPLGVLKEGTKLRYLDEVARVNTQLRDKVSQVMTEGRFPLILGGDHSIAIGSLAGVLESKKDIGVIWFDAHGDINTEETSPTGNIHGMPVAVSLGFGHEMLTSISGSNSLKGNKLVYVGCRDLDSGEKKFLKQLGITVFTMHEVDRYGMTDIIERAIAIASQGTDGIHVSFDVDCMDPIYIQGTGTRVEGGLTFRECNLALEMIAMTEKVISAEFVEVNPLIDHKNRTAKMTIPLIGSLLGESLI